MNRWIAAVVIAAGLAGALGSSSAASAAPVTKTHHAAKPKPKKAKSKKTKVTTTHALGHAQQAKTELADDPYSVAVTAVVDPAQPATATFNAPKTGTRLVAVDLVIKDKSKKAISDDANNDTSVVGSNGQTYQATFNAVQGCTNFNSGGFQLDPGMSATGCVVFAVPVAVKVAKVEWSSSGGFGTSFVWWKG